MNSMIYKGYTARIDYDDDDKILVGSLAGIRDIVSFHGATVKELEKGFHEAVNHYLAACKKFGDTPQKPYSGKLSLRIAPEIHAAVATTSHIQGKSINQWASDVLEKAANKQ